MKKTSKLLALTLTALMLLSVCIMPMSASAIDESPLQWYCDVDTDAWYYDDVDNVLSYGLMRGTLTMNGKNNLFSPEDMLTREQFVTVLYRLASGIPAYAAETFHDYKDIYEYRSKFSDVDRFAWYGSALMWAEKYGITEGVSDTEFGIGQPITREEIITFIARYLDRMLIKTTEAESTVESFADADTISDWAVESVEYMRKSGVIEGDEKGNFNPKSTATRAEAAAIAVRLYEKIEIDFDALFSTDIVSSIKFKITMDAYDEDDGHIWDTRSYTVTDPNEVADTLRYITEGEIDHSEFYVMYTPGCRSHLFLYDKDGNTIATVDFTPDHLGFFAFKNYYFDTGYFSELYDKMMSDPDNAQ